MSLRPRLDDLLELRHQARALGLASHHLVNSSFSGLFASVFRGSGLDFDEVRAYREGDDVRNMEWKVTARTGVPHMKVFREERERTVMLCVDCGPHMRFGTRRTFKSVQAARAAALLGWAADNHHDRIGAMLYGTGEDQGLDFFRPLRGHRSLWRMLDRLSRMEAPRAACGQDCLLAVLQRIDRGAGTGSLIFVIGDFNRELSSLETTLGRLQQRHEVVLLPVDDPADRELPAMGPVVFENAAGELFEVDTDDAQGRAAYEAAWHRRREALERLANRLAITLIPLSTAEDVRATLALGLRRRLEAGWR